MDHVDVDVADRLALRRSQTQHDSQSDENDHNGGLKNNVQIVPSICGDHFSFPPPNDHGSTSASEKKDQTFQGTANVAARRRSDSFRIDDEETNVEDWLVKQREMQARLQASLAETEVLGAYAAYSPPTATDDPSYATCSTNSYSRNVKTKTREQDVHGTANVAKRGGNDSFSIDEIGTNVEDWLAEQSEKVSWDEPRAPGAYYATTCSPPTINSTSAGIAVEDRDVEVCGPGLHEEVITADVILQPAPGHLIGDQFVAEVVVPTVVPMVVEGRKAGISNSRILCMSIAAFALCVVVAVAIYIGISLSRGAKNPRSVDVERRPAPTIHPVNMNMTIAETLVDSFEEFPILSFIPSAQIILDVLNQTDRNFTFFGFSTDASIVQISTSIIGKLTAPAWNGHTLDIFQSLTVEGQGLLVEDMYDGMILTSLAGYSLNIQLDPFRVNNFTIHWRERDRYFRNGVIHHLQNIPNPLAPWFAKSNYDVLLETNKQRNGDLSNFIAMVNASSDLKFKLQAGPGPTTVFVPNNEALATLLDLDTKATLESGVIIQSSWLYQLMLNHLVTGNFAISAWNTIPAGTKVSDSEVTFVTQAGQVLELKIRDRVTINGECVIVQEDIFSEYGIIHVIDKPLLLPV